MNPSPQHAPHTPHQPSASNAALLIDFDNVTMGIRSDLQTQLGRLLNSEMIKGKVAVQRAYADWRRYPQYIAPLSESSVDLIFAPAFGSNKKNATDIRLAIDALELVFTRPEIGTFILLSGDSDFSSLVLKLKEYGKYVIGVGIRESASDLLVQNCDEYYSYSELTGLRRTSEVEVKRRDPWELVVEAVVRMQENDDVMRSDRLKQVMQEIDPHFDEKDAGVNKFSKFVVEAGRRGLVTLSKLENGQFEVGIGPDANVRLPQKSDADSSPRPPSRRTEPAESVAGSAISLAQAFQLLRNALRDLGAVDGESVTGDQARTKVKELSSAADDPIFETRRFQRMLRQAHDASVIDLTRSGRGYRVALSSATEPEESPAPATTEEKPARRSRRKKKSSRAAASGDEGNGKDQPTKGESAKSEPGKHEAAKSEPAKSEPAAAKAAEPAKPAERTQSGSSRSRNPRYRRGSKGGRRRSAEGGTATESSAQTAASAEAPPSNDQSSGGRGDTGGGRPSGERSAAPQRSMGPRTGSRGGRGRGDRGSASSTDRPKTSPATSEPAEQPREAREIRGAAAMIGEQQPASDRNRPMVASPESDADAGDDAGENSLLRRMSAAVQRALLGHDD